MPPKPTNWPMMGKLTAVFLGVSIGGPAFTWWLVPTEEELFKKYNPELQKKSLENRQQKQEEFDFFVNKLKEYSKDTRPIWEVAAEAERQDKRNKLAAQGGKIRQSIEDRKAAADGLHSPSKGLGDA